MSNRHKRTPAQSSEARARLRLLQAQQCDRHFARDERKSIEMLQRCPIPDHFSNVKTVVSDLDSQRRAFRSKDGVAPETSSFPLTLHFRVPSALLGPGNESDSNATLQTGLEPGSTPGVNVIVGQKEDSSSELVNFSSSVTGHPLSPPPVQLSREDLLSFGDDETIRASGRSPIKKTFASYDEVSLANEFGEFFGSNSDSFEDEKTSVHVLAVGEDSSDVGSDGESTFSFHASDDGTNFEDSLSDGQSGAHVNQETDLDNDSVDDEMEDLDVPPPRPPSRLSLLDEEIEDEPPSSDFVLTVPPTEDNNDAVDEQQDEEDEAADRAIQRALSARRARFFHTESRTAVADMRYVLFSSRYMSDGGNPQFVDEEEEENSNCQKGGACLRRAPVPCARASEIWTDNRGRSAVVRRPLVAIGARTR
ncbi:hypothetical protein PUNSTDRAFT_140965 [Punctularia strigosozonata HHB-11173 SS5]|uniref:uncharacterized protein n=1 Tax=Punctularia strigosozonata (strain HHB-11173) TaxID=741275 RepID=UPI0004416F10|nr:uncharacterized protein PUNSTDRAFT_140965 [Punctularia strigosozonata HHB-11173 SS5]EIN14747.1 hypothetical protein PUNSTDRAFT_140965 [Punctularia strigosozonata HHB-11173 SS5]